MRKIAAALPHNLPPRLIGREAAAAYVGVSANTFDRMIEAGTMPPAKRIHGTRRGWDVRALDRACDALPEAGEADTDDTWADVLGEGHAA